MNNIKLHQDHFEFSMSMILNTIIETKTVMLVGTIWIAKGKIPYPQMRDLIQRIYHGHVDVLRCSSYDWAIESQVQTYKNDELLIVARLLYCLAKNSRVHDGSIHLLINWKSQHDVKIKAYST